MKKLYSILITLVLLITCFSCSSNEEASFNTQTKEEDQITIVEENKQEEDDEVKQDTSNEEVNSTIVDKQEEVKVLDNGANPNYNYWVTFYDHDGNILQQDAIKYGTVPTYWSDTPYYEDGTNWYKGVGWTDAYGRDVTEFQPIKGNTRFYAKYEVGGAVSHSSSHSESSNPAPAPSSACSNTDDLYYIYSVPFTALGGDWGESHIYKYSGGAFSYYTTNVNATFAKQASGDMVEQYHWYHVDGDVPTECTDPNHHGMVIPHVCGKTSSFLLHITSLSLPFDVYADVYEWNSGSNIYEKIKNNYHIDGIQFSPMPSSSDIWIHTNDYDTPYMGSQQNCDDYEAHTIS